MDSYQPMKQIDATEATIEDILFSKNTYRVPRYQRPYSWGEDEIEELWEDIKNDKKLFIGSFIFNQPQGKNQHLDVIDGQQRLTTIMLFMAELRNIASRDGVDAIAKDLQRNQIFRKETGQDNSILRLQSSETIESLFTGVMKNSKFSFPEDLNPDQENFVDNFNTIRDILKEELKEHDGETGDFVVRMTNLIKELRGIRIDVADETQAYRIFETVNARGADLSIADLLKNLIFRNLRPSGNQMDEAKDKWSEVRENILLKRDQFSKAGKMKRFILYHWQSINGKTTSGKLFKDIKQQIEEDEYDEFLEDLLESSDNYRMLVYADDEEWSNFDKGDKIYESLEALRYMRVTQCYIFLLAVMNNIERLEQNPQRVFENIESFSFIYHAVVGGPGNKVEKLYAKYASELNKVCVETESDEERRKKVSSVIDSLIQDLKDIQPSKEVFLENFEEWGYKQSKLGRWMCYYALTNLEKEKSTGEKTLNFKEVNIEHLLPTTPPKEYEKSDEYSEIVNRLGNLTLLSRRINGAIGNDLPKEKLDSLEESEIKLTQEMVEEVRDNGGWNEETIKRRHRELGEELYELLSL